MYLLDQIIRKVEDNQLHKSRDFFWVFTYPYQTDQRGNHYHSDINVRNDQSIRELIEYMSIRGLIKDIDLVEHPYVPDNIRDFQSYQFVYSLGCRVASIDKLVSLKRDLQTRPKGDQVASFDTNTGLLTVGDKLTQVRKGSKQAALLTILFKSQRSRGYEWPTDELMDQLLPEYDSKSKRLAYDTANNLNRKLADEISINDLLIPSLTSVRVNPKYLS